MQPPDASVSQPIPEDDLSFGVSPTRTPLFVCLGGALLGCIFAALSTSDFIQHLDRQVDRQAERPEGAGRPARLRPCACQAYR